MKKVLVGFLRSWYVLSTFCRLPTFVLRFLGYIKNVEHPSIFKKFKNARIYSCVDKNVAILGIARSHLGYLGFNTFSRIMDQSLKMYKILAILAPCEEVLIPHRPHISSKK